MNPAGQAIAHAVTGLPSLLRAPVAPAASRSIRVTARALDGMLKEAIVTRDDSGTGWRFLCDEGPYLNGTDLAPPPLAWFAAGMAAHHAALVVDAALRRDQSRPGLGFTQHTWYRMDGSALKGTMTGGAMPVEWVLDTGANDPGAVVALAREALAYSVAEDLMARPHSGAFSLTANGGRLAPGRVLAHEGAVPEAPWSALAEVASMPVVGDEFVRKLAAVERSDDPTHGAGASMRESQRRELHLETRWTPAEEGLGDMAVHLRQPLGSRFGFCARLEPGAAGPDGLDLLFAGIALCFLTQMGRYAGITQSDLSRYAVIQDVIIGDEPPRLASLITHAYLDSLEDAETCRRFLDMSEQTCFLHAATREQNPTDIRTVTQTSAQEHS